MRNEFDRIKRLPPYVFAEVNNLKAKLRSKGKDIIDFGMGNPDMPTPKHIRQKLKETVEKPGTGRYSTSKGINGLRKAQAAYYKRRFDVNLDPENEVTKARLYGNENLVKDLIPSIDNLFRTLEHQDIEAKTVPAEGISLIVREIISALEKNGISVIDPKGEEFDPKEHEALSVSEDDKEKPNIVLEVFQKGFKFNERVVRPAMVVVNKK